MVNKAVYTAVVVKVCMCRLVLDFVDYSIGKSHHNAYCIAHSAHFIIGVAEAYITYPKG